MTKVLPQTSDVLAVVFAFGTCTLRGAEEDSPATLDQSVDFAKQVIAAKDIAELGLNMKSHLAPQVSQKLAAACESDPLLGENAVRRVVQLYLAAQQNGAFRGQNEEANGNNFASLLLDDVGTKAPGFGTLRLAWRLFHHDISGQFAHSSWERLHGWNKALFSAFENGGGFKDRAAGLRAVLGPVRAIIGGDPPGLMLAGFTGFAHKLDPWEMMMVRRASEDLARDGGDLAPLAKVLSASIHLAQNRLLDGSPFRPDAVWLRENGDWLAQLRTLADDPATPAENRFAIAAHLARELAPMLDSAVILHGMEAGTQALEWDQPTNGYAWEPLLIAFNMLPDSPAWREAAERFHKAWVRRCRFESEPNGTPHRFAPWTVCTYHVLETAARLGGPKEFKSLAVLHRLDTPPVFALMVRHGLHGLAAEWLRSKANQRASWKVAGLGFREGDAAAVNRFCAELKDPALELLARIHVANNPPGDDGAPWAGPDNVPRWDARLAALVPAFRSTRFPDDKLRQLCLNLLCDGPATGLLLNEEVEKAAAAKPAGLVRINGSTPVHDRLRVHSALVCNGAAAGNLKPLKNIMTEIRVAAGSPSDYLYESAATFIVGELHEAMKLLVPESDAQGIPRWRDAGDLALEFLEGEPEDKNISHALLAQVALHALADSAAGLTEWRARLDNNKSEHLANMIKEYHDDLAGDIAAFCRGPREGLRTRVERLRLLNAFLTDPWVRPVTSEFQLLLHSLIRKGAFTLEEVLANAGEISAADAGNGRRLRELAALAWRRGEKNLAGKFLEQAVTAANNEKLRSRYALGGSEAR